MRLKRRRKPAVSGLFRKCKTLRCRFTVVIRYMVHVAKTQLTA